MHLLSKLKRKNWLSDPDQFRKLLQNSCRELFTSRSQKKNRITHDTESCCKTVISLTASKMAARESWPHWLPILSCNSAAMLDGSVVWTLCCSSVMMNSLFVYSIDQLSVKLIWWLCQSNGSCISSRLASAVQRFCTHKAMHCNCSALEDEIQPTWSTKKHCCCCENWKKYQ